MGITLLCRPAFGWALVVGQIVVIYVIFIFIQRKVESRSKR